MAQSMRLIVSIVERGHGVAMQKLYTARQVFLHLQCAGRGHRHLGDYGYSGPGLQ